MREQWLEHTGRRLRMAGFHNGGARAALLHTLALTGGGLTAPELHQQVRQSGRRVGAASVYRVLTELESIGAIRRLEIGQSQALFELVDPGGEHHHHIVCDACGRTQTFADAGLEEAIGRIEQDASFAVHAHDVILHGVCPACSPERRTPDRKITPVPMAASARRQRRPLAPSR